MSTTIAGKSAYLYVLPQMSDWETGFVTSELHSGRYFAEAGCRSALLAPAGSR